MAIDQFKLECDTNADTAQYNELVPNSLLRSNLAIEKTENSIAAAATTITTSPSAPSKESNAISDMETLYWHTHGSLLWQH